MARRTRSRIVLVLACILAVEGCSSVPDVSTPSGASAASAALSDATGAATRKRARPTPTSGPTPTPSAVGLHGFPGTAILGAPTDSSVVLSLIAGSDLDVFVEYGSASGQYPVRTTTMSMKAGQPLEVALSGLSPNASTAYRIRYRAPGTTVFQAAAEQSFHTQRSVNDSFTFAVEADPHVDVDGKMQPALFRAELENVGAAQPDFLVDLGDTFLGDKFATSAAQLSAQYANVRNYFGIVGPSVPLYLVNGNHEGEDGYGLDGTANNLAVWSAVARRTYYPEPSAGSFYSAATGQVPFIGERDSYYAWQWGDALFVVLDPYSYTTTNPKQSGDMWDWTLGEAQYRWLTQVLSSSPATYKFVFFPPHDRRHPRRHRAGRPVRVGRGHASPGPTSSTPSARVGPADPPAVREVRRDDLLPGSRPSLRPPGARRGRLPGGARRPRRSVTRRTRRFAYTSGVILDSPGSLKVTVASTGITVDYVRSSVTASGAPGPDNGTVVYSYTILRPSGT